MTEDEVRRIAREEAALILRDHALAEQALADKTEKEAAEERRRTRVAKAWG